MTVYYVDPINGDSANGGTASNDAFSSVAQLFDGTLVGGLTLGDLVNLMASGTDAGTDELGQTTSFGRQENASANHGSTASVIIFRSVNASTLAQDGTQYVLGCRNQGGNNTFSELEGFHFHNIAFVGGIGSFTSGSLVSAFLNCEFTDEAGGLSYSSFTRNFGSMDNASHMFRNCLFIKRNPSNAYARITDRMGSVNVGSTNFDACEILNLEKGIQDFRGGGLHNCRFKNLDDYAILFETRANRDGRHTIVNNIFDDIGTDCFDIEPRRSSGQLNHPKAGRFYGNLYNNIGGYIYNYTGGSVTEINPRAESRRRDGQLNWEGEVFQNVTSGVHSVPFGATYDRWGWATKGGYGPTAAVFGLTHESDGTGLMLGTGDTKVFNHFSTSAGLGVMLKEFTELAGGSVPEFGDVF